MRVLTTDTIDRELESRAGEVATMSATISSPLLAVFAVRTVIPLSRNACCSRCSVARSSSMTRIVDNVPGSPFCLGIQRGSM